MNRRSKPLALILAIILVLGMLPATAMAAGTDITGQITDPNLLQAIRAALSKGSGDPITDDEMLGLTSLDAHSLGITSIAGLQYATNLTHLELYNNAIADLTPLQNLTNLTYLDLSNNQIGSAADLTGLTNLTWLSLIGNQISDVSPLSTMTKMKYLWLSENTISDISALSAMDDLEVVDLYTNNLQDISVLSDKTKLTSVSVRDNNINNISAVSGLTNLLILDAAQNSISDISALAGLTKLTMLYLYTNQIQDISPLAGLTNLYYLDLYHNNITDISVLAGLTNLQTLYINENAIRDISPLAGLANLTGLSIRNNNISDISALATLMQSANLSFLYLRNNYLNLTEGSQTRNIIDDLVAAISDVARWNEQNALSATPFGASAAAQGTDSIELSWEHMPDTTYEVSRSAGTDPAVDITLSSNTDTAYTDTGLSPNIEYTYTIKAHFWQGDGVDPITVQRIVSAATVPQPPTDHTLLSITPPAAVTGVANGAAKTAAALNLPAAVTLVTNDGIVSAGVAWDAAGSIYDPSVTAAQTFTVNGAVTLPAGVVNPNGVGLAVAVSVSVNGVSAPAPAGGPVSDPYVKDPYIVDEGDRVTVDLTKGSTILSDAQMKRLTEKNEDEPVTLNGDGYAVTFPAGTLQNGTGRDYDLGLAFNAGGNYGAIRSLAGDNFVLMLSFNHSGALPGEAEIRIRVGAQYARRILYYYSYDPQTGKLQYMQSATVDADGYATVTQSHCSSYVFTLYGNSEIGSVPKTGDGSSPWVWLPLCGAAAAGIAALTIWGKRKRSV